MTSWPKHLLRAALCGFTVVMIACGVFVVFGDHMGLPLSAAVLAVPTVGYAVLVPRRQRGRAADTNAR
jgi:hypothetical protein